MMTFPKPEYIVAVLRSAPPGAERTLSEISSTAIPVTNRSAPVPQRSNLLGQSSLPVTATGGQTT